MEDSISSANQVRGYEPKPMSAEQGWDLEQVTVSEVAVGCGCPAVNRIARLHF